MTLFFLIYVLVSNFTGLGLEAKVETSLGLASDKFCGLGLGLGQVGLDYSPAFLVRLAYRLISWKTLSSFKETFVCLQLYDSYRPSHRPGLV